MTEDQFARFVDYVEGRFQHMESHFQQMATKDHLQQLESKVDLLAIDVARLENVLKAEVGSLRQEMRERFEIVHDRIVALEKGQEDLRIGISKVREQVNELTVQLSTRIERLEAQGRETNVKLIDLKEEVQQRFRMVTDRLSALEQRIAA